MEATCSRRTGVRPREDSGTGFTEFVGTNTSILLRKAYLLTGTRFAAEELVQDTLVRLYPRWARVENADVPLAYVQRSLTNNFLNQRRKGQDREILTDAVDDRPGGTSAEDEVTDRDEMWTLLQTLSARERAVVVLRYYGGLSDGEIADHLGCRPGTVRSLMSRALAALRRRVHSDAYPPARPLENTDNPEAR